MALIRNEESKEGELTVTFTDGFLGALQKVVEKLGFKDEESFLKFALAVGTHSATRAVTVLDVTGTRITLIPNKDLLTEEEQAKVEASS